MSRLDPRLLLQGYATGIFPMADSREADELFWVEPRNRAIIPLDHFHVSRSLGRTIRSGKFTVTRDRDFTLLDCQFMTDHLASLGVVSVTRESYVALLSAALGGGGAASAGALVEGLGRAAEAPADFAALDRLLDVTGAAGAAGPAGYVIWQLLGHTS